MKSLLRTLPRVQTVELWSAKVTTNLEDVIDHARTNRKPEGPVLRFLVEVYSDVEMQDLIVGRASAVRRGNKISFRARSTTQKHMRVFKTELEMRLSHCKHCRQPIYVETGSPEKQAEFHARNCPVVAMIEVMED